MIVLSGLLASCWDGPEDRQVPYVADFGSGPVRLDDTASGHPAGDRDPAEDWALGSGWHWVRADGPDAARQPAYAPGFWDRWLPSWAAPAAVLTGRVDLPDDRHRQRLAVTYRAGGGPVAVELRPAGAEAWRTRARLGGEPGANATRRLSLDDLRGRRFRLRLRPVAEGQADGFRLHGLRIGPPPGDRDGDGHANAADAFPDDPAWHRPHRLRTVTVEAVAPGRARLQWEPPEGDPELTGYRILRKPARSGAYRPVAEIPADVRVRVDSGVDNGAAYFYRIQGLGPDGTPIAASRPRGHLQAVATATVGDLAAVSTDGGVRLTWSATGADRYRIYRAAGDGPPEALATPAQAPYTDRSAGAGPRSRYWVAPRQAFANPLTGGTVHREGERTGPVSAGADLPAVTGLQANAEGGAVTLDWDVVDGATGYRILRRPLDGPLRPLGRVAGDRTRYRDRQARRGQAYLYTVVATREGRSGPAPADGGVLAVLRPGPLAGLAHSQGADGVRLTWKGRAERYRILAADAEGERRPLTIVTGSTYRDPDAPAGRRYWVQALTRVRHPATGKTVERTGPMAGPVGGAAPEQTLTGIRLEAGTDGVRLRWRPVEGAAVAGYTVARRPASGGAWTRLTPRRIPDSKFRDRTVPAGQAVVYRITARGPDGAALTANAAGPVRLVGDRLVRSGLPPAAGAGPPGAPDKGAEPESEPEGQGGDTGHPGEDRPPTGATPERLGPVQVTRTEKALVLQWPAVEGASGYTVARRSQGAGSWVRLTTEALAGTRYTDPGAQPSTGYRYRVTARGPAGRLLARSAPVAAWRPPRPGPVTGLSAELDRGRVRLTWEGASGRYRIFRRRGSDGAPTRRATTGDTHFAEQLSPGKPATYWVARRLRVTHPFDGSQVVRDGPRTGPVTVPAPLAAVEGLRAGVREGAVHLRWQPTAGAAGYRIDRQSGASKPWQPLTETAGTTRTYTDTDVAAGSAYRYRVRAVAGDGRQGRASAPATAVVDRLEARIQNLTARRDAQGVHLHWDVTPNRPDLRYRIRRGPADGDLTAAGTVSDTAYHDTATPPAQAQAYRVVPVQRLANPFGGDPVTATGPASRRLRVAARPALTLRLAGGHRSGAGPPRYYHNGGALPVPGRIAPAPGRYTVTARAGERTVEQTGESAAFSLQLPTAKEAATWRLRVREKGAAGRTAEARLQLIPDRTGPDIHFQGAKRRTVAGQTVTFQGRITDAGAGVTHTALVNRAYPDAPLALDRRADGRFRVEVPLAEGGNRIALEAADALGNRSEAVRLVTRKAGKAGNDPDEGSHGGDSPGDSEGRGDGESAGDGADDGADPDSGREGGEDRPDGGNDGKGQPDDGRSGAGDDGNPDQDRPGEGDGGDRPDDPPGEGDSGQAPGSGDGDSGDDGGQPPTLNLDAGPDGVVRAGELVVVSGRAHSVADTVTFRIAGQTVTRAVSDGTAGFRQTVEVPAADGARTPLTVTASDAYGKATAELTLRTDGGKPTLTLTNDLRPTPATNRVTRTRLTLRGRATDAGLAGVTVAGESAGLTPGAAADTYRFARTVELPPDKARTVTVTAWDRAGNERTRRYRLLSDPQASLNVVRPGDDAQITADGGSAEVPVVVRVQDLPGDGWLEAVPDGGEPRAFAPVGGGMARTTVPLSAQEAPHRLRIRAKAPDGSVLATAERRITVTARSEQPLSVVATQPANQARGIEPNRPIEIHFSRQVDPARIRIRVEETVHGKTYDLKKNEGKGFSAMGELPLVRVDRDRARVLGGLAPVSGGRQAEFDPARDFAYGAQVFARVEKCQSPEKKDCQAIKRLTFRTRSLPTLLSGVVQDQFGNPVPEVEVRLASTGKTTQTGKRGNFGFGYGRSADEDVEPGQRELILNPDWQDRDLGVRRIQTRVRLGQANPTGAIQLTRLNPNRPFHRVGGGIRLEGLVGNRLDLDLRNARIRFPGGATKSPVHIQLLPLNQIPYPPAFDAAVPNRLFSFQPAGIEVTGAVRLSIRLPQVANSSPRSFPNGMKVTLVGLDPAMGKLVPIGVGEVDNGWVVAKEVGHLSRLDFLGYAFAGAGAYPLLEAYADGEIGIRELRNRMAGIDDAE